MTSSDEKYDPETARQRFERTLRGALNTAPQPRLQVERTALPVHEYVVIDGRFLVAAVVSRSNRSITADLYRNLSDLRAGRVMERGITLAF